MKRTYLPSELPKAKTKKEAIGNILNLASGKGFRIKNPYSDDFFEMRRMEYAIKILNDLISGKIKKLPNEIKRFKVPKMYKELLKELKKKMMNWKL